MFSKIVGKLQELPPYFLKVMNKWITQITDLYQFSLFYQECLKKLVYNQLYKYLDENKHFFFRINPAFGVYTL